MNLSLNDKIKIIRNKTGISYILCKEALIKNNYDLNLSIEYIKKFNDNLVVLKKDRKVKSGFIYFLMDDLNKTIVIIDAGSETDFVSKSNDFSIYLNKIANLILYDDDYKLNFYKNLNDIKLDFKINVILNEMINKFQENIVINRIRKYFTSDGILFYYVHKVQNINKIFSFVSITEQSSNYRDLAHDIAMHITAMKPTYLSILDVPNSVLSDLKEKKNVANNLINNYYVENVLLEQYFIKDNKINIKSLIENKFNILHFERFEVGEDL